MIEAHRDELHLRLYYHGVGADSDPDFIREIYAKDFRLRQTTADKLRPLMSKETNRINAVVGSDALERSLAEVAFSGVRTMQILGEDFEEWAYDGSERNLLWLSLTHSTERENAALLRFARERPLGQVLQLAACVIDLAGSDAEQYDGIRTHRIYTGQELEHLPRLDQGSTLTTGY